MENIMISAVAVFTVIVLGLLLIAARNMNRHAYLYEGEKANYPRGYFVSIGISIGGGVGVALGLVIGQLSLGIPIGATIGAVLGGIWERGIRIRPLNKKERGWYRWLVASGILVLAAGVTCFVLIQ